MCINTDEGGQRLTVGRGVCIPLYRNRKGKGGKLTEYGPEGKWKPDIPERLRKLNLILMIKKRKEKNYGQVFDLFGSRT